MIFIPQFYHLHQHNIHPACRYQAPVCKDYPPTFFFLLPLPLLPTQVQGLPTQIPCKSQSTTITILVTTRNTLAVDPADFRTVAIGRIRTDKATFGMWLTGKWALFLICFNSFGPHIPSYRDLCHLRNVVNLPVALKVVVENK